MLGDISSVIQAVASVLVLVLGAIWTVYLYKNRRGRFPGANITHQINARRINGGQVLLRIDVFVANVGNVLLQFEHAVVRVNQVLPVKNDFLGDITQDEAIKSFNFADVEWPDIVNRPRDWGIGERPEIEPNEIDEFNYDFIVPSEAKIIEIYTYFTNVEKRPAKRGLIERVIEIYKYFRYLGKRPTMNRPTEIGWGHTSLHDLTDPKILPVDNYNC